MASKVRFSIDGIRASLLAQRDRLLTEIDEKIKKIEASNFDTEVKVWRKAAKDRILDLASRIDDASDAEIRQLDLGRSFPDSNDRYYNRQLGKYEPWDLRSIRRERESVMKSYASAISLLDAVVPEANDPVGTALFSVSELKTMGIYHLLNH